MKRFLLSVTMLAAVCISAKAQFSLGVKGGVNFSKIDADNFNHSNVTGYQAGLFARIGGGLFVQPEVYLSSTGGDFDSNSNGTVYSAKVKFTNLNIPLLLGYKLGAKNLNVHVMAGPIYTYILNKDESFSNNFQTAFQDFGTYKNSTLGFQAGGGVDIGPITADLRYEGGLTKINDDFGQRQHLWALSVGFKFF